MRDSYSSKENVYSRAPFEQQQPQKSNIVFFYYLLLDTAVPQTKIEKTNLDKSPRLAPTRNSGSITNPSLNPNLNPNLLKKDRKDCIIY